MIRVRFAPSPTGYLHLGNVRTALFNYLFCQREKGRFVLRIEDTDRERARPEYEQALIEDLTWLGLGFDEGPHCGGPGGPYRQSERLTIYEDHIRRLVDQGKAYECYVTEEETEQMKHKALAEKRPVRFDNRGRYFSREEIAKRKAQGIRPTVRFKIENPKLTFHDLIRGEVSFNLDDMVGDFVIRRADGTPTFHLAVCVDDGLMEISHVIRGEDHLPNTPKHILLLESLGYPVPQYAHLPLIHGPGGEPLSKRLDSISVRHFREAGYLSEALANYIALLGWSPGENREVLTWEDLKELFDLSRIHKSPACYDPDKLNWLNGEHLRRIPEEAFILGAEAFLGQRGLGSNDKARLRRILPVFKDGIERFDQLPARLACLDENFEYDDESVLRSPEAREVLKIALGLAQSLPGGDHDFALRFIEDLKKSARVKGRQLMMPLRMALTGKGHGPELRRFLDAFGRESVCLRLQRALGKSDEF